MLRYGKRRKAKLLRAQNWPRYSFSRRSKLRLDEFGVKFSRQGFQPRFTPPLVLPPSRELLLLLSCLFRELLAERAKRQSSRTCCNDLSRSKALFMGREDL